MTEEVEKDLTEYYKTVWFQQTSLMIQVLSNRKLGHHPELLRYRQGLTMFTRNPKYFL